ncbi:phage tail protein [Paucibacter sp. DJ4R-1]|nr:phage tail protein [Paucibacter sp. DJ4R-1]
MSYYTLIGAQFFMSTGLDATKAVTAISNTAPPVVSAAAHGYANNDELLLLNGLDDLNEVIVRAGSVAAGTFTIPGYDTTNTEFYPAAATAGTAQKVSGWTPLGQVLGISPSGGEASFEEVKPYDRRNAVKIFTGFSASSLELTLGWDRARADQVAMQTASRTATKRAFKFVLPGGVYGYAYGTVSASALPQFETVLKQKVVLTMAGQFTSF